MTTKDKGTYPCAYFAKDGYCAKGKYCEFVHDKPQPCKNFRSPSGCRFGSKCMFSHSKKAFETSILLRPSATEIQTLTQVDESPMIIDSNPQLQESAQSAWGFEDTSVYFYGAAGTSTFTRPKRYNEAVGLVHDLDYRSHQTLATKKECTYFKAGYCMYGDMCRHLHPDDKKTHEYLEINHEDMSNDTISSAECGICLSTPENGVYGVLNNCNCMFCCDCIKNWRKEGLTYEESTQVRLCPLCRVVSHYIIPSRIVPTQEQKLKLINAHKRSLSMIPCKVSQRRHPVIYSID
jgi:hypothetical protein